VKSSPKEEHEDTREASTWMHVMNLKNQREREREIGVLLGKQLENNPEEKQFTKKLCATNAM
jgi:hypothetical protein